MNQPVNQQANIFGSSLNYHIVLQISKV